MTTPSRHHLPPPHHFIFISLGAPLPFIGVENTPKSSPLVWRVRFLHRPTLAGALPGRLRGQMERAFIRQGQNT